jgi:hypothetical protein
MTSTAYFAVEMLVVSRIPAISEQHLLLCCTFILRIWTVCRCICRCLYLPVFFHLHGLCSVTRENCERGSCTINLMKCAGVAYSRPCDRIWEKSSTYIKVTHVSTLKVPDKFDAVFCM